MRDMSPTDKALIARPCLQQLILSVCGFVQVLQPAYSQQELQDRDGHAQQSLIAAVLDGADAQLPLVPAQLFMLHPACVGAQWSGPEQNPDCARRYVHRCVPSFEHPELGVRGVGAGHGMLGEFAAEWAGNAVVAAARSALAAHSKLTTQACDLAEVHLADILHAAFEAGHAAALDLYKDPPRNYCYPSTLR